jgi:tetratricopeptide (TPR) repeat protein
MPSHTFIALGLWQESIQSNLAAKAAAEKAGWVQEELHSMDYLVYAYLQGAQLQRASAILEEFKGATVNDKAHTLATDYSLAAAPARFAVEQRRWSDAASLEPRPSRFPVTQATTYFARALGAAHTGAIADGKKDMQQISTLRDGLLQTKQEYWAKQLEVQRVTAEAWLMWAQGNGKGALALMRTAADLEDSTYKHPIAPAQLLPARELLGDMLLALGKPDQALVEYEASMRVAPNRFNGLYGAAKAAESSGNREKAATYYAQLLAVCEQADTERPEAQHARLYLAGK